MKLRNEKPQKSKRDLANRDLTILIHEDAHRTAVSKRLTGLLSVVAVTRVGDIAKAIKAQEAFLRGKKVAAPSPSWLVGVSEMLPARLPVGLYIDLRKLQKLKPATRYLAFYIAQNNGDIK